MPTADADEFPSYSGVADELDIYTPDEIRGWKIEEGEDNS